MTATSANRPSPFGPLTPETTPGSHPGGAAPGGAVSALPQRERRRGFSDEGEFWCPHGHRIALDAPIGEWGYVTCTHRAPPGPGERAAGPECNARLFVLVLPRRVKGAKPLVWVAEVDWREVQYMEAQEWDVPEILDFLGFSYDPPKQLTANQRRRDPR